MALSIQEKQNPANSAASLVKEENETLRKPKRALFSLYDKTGAMQIAEALLGMDADIVASSGTYYYLQENIGISKEVAGFSNLPSPQKSPKSPKSEKNPVSRLHEVAKFYGLKEILGGRVKTLHPHIHGGILYKRDDEQQLRELAENGIVGIDLVFINLYPFGETLKKNPPLDELIEMIDIGGPALLRAAAKNFRYTAALVDPADYLPLLEELSTLGGISLQLRQRLAVKVFEYTAAYDALIESALREKLLGQKSFSLHLLQQATLRYGENPHQDGALYSTKVVSGMESMLKLKAQPSIRDSLLKAQQLKGDTLSYNNYLDGERALETLAEFSASHAATVVKHGNSCGLAVSDRPLGALSMALEGDKVSSYGSIIAMNFCVDEAMALVLKSLFIEILIAPKFTKEAMACFQKRKKLRILQLAIRNTKEENVRDASREQGRTKMETLSRQAEFRMHALRGGMLLQSADSSLAKVMQSVTENSMKAEDEELFLFSYKAVKQLKSNAIAVAMRFHTKEHGRGFLLLGMGAGQPNRLDAVVKLALPKMLENKKRFMEAGILNSEEKFSENTVAASDAFFPFQDSIDPLYTAGIRKIIQPGGSIRDAEVIARANGHGMTMLFTGTRHFLH